jgi:hypothetical protein
MWRNQRRLQAIDPAREMPKPRSDLGQAERTRSSIPDSEYRQAAEGWPRRPLCGDRKHGSAKKVLLTNLLKSPLTII